MPLLALSLLHRGVRVEFESGRDLGHGRVPWLVRGIGPDALDRHAKTHLPAASVKAQAVADVANGDSLLRQITDLQRRTLAILDAPDEWAAFLEAADSHPELRKAARLWRLKLLTASRISEMIDLRWSAVDFERGSIAIGQRKTGRTKTLTLAPAMRAVLAAVLRGIGEAPVFA
jgi:integrase